MLNPEALLVRTDEHAALLAAQQAAATYLDVDPTSLVEVRAKPDGVGGANSRVMIDTLSQDGAPSIAVKVEPTNDGAGLLAARQSDVAIINARRTAGAPVEEHRMPPRFYPYEPLGTGNRTNSPTMNGFVVTATTFLPGVYSQRLNQHTDIEVFSGTQASWAVGRALAQVHDLGKTPKLELPEYQPLEPTRKLVETFKALHDNNKLPRLQELVFTEHALGQLVALYEVGQEAQDTLMDIYRNRPLSHMLKDNNASNTRFDAAGKPVFIDLNDIDDPGQAAGVGLYNFARGLDNAVFGRSLDAVHDQMLGYQDERGQTFDKVDLMALKLARIIGRARYATTLMPRLADAALAQEKPHNFPYLLAESLKRISRGVDYWPPGAETWESEFAYMQRWHARPSVA